ncbi:hypothetical protein [Cupriavidus nantongensis]|uniref:Uncharacterized protein n=1 Tax=Cupriavidus nantongensis TaxID=1796606 RepID=A0A142JN08_9BURK|nr:hypothetical protein [Cupriavidus nantongensis]AMR79470.1 hypothetical protein A2G96_17930 [Cupriavidus nantongensis]
MTEAQILYERGPYWVKRGAKFFEIYRAGATHSTRVGVVGFSFGLSRCIAEIDRRMADDERRKGDAR